MEGYSSSLKALCIHGIQSTPEDWQAAERELAGSLTFEHAKRQFFNERKMEFEKWEEEVVNYETELIRKGAHNILVAHSYATHRVGRILQNVPQVYGAVLLNPPQNHMTIKTKHRHRQKVPEDRTFMNTLFHNITFDMTDDQYADFIERQEIAYKEEQREISRQGGFLKNGPSFQERIQEIPPEKEILIIRASGDAWDVGDIQPTEKRMVTDLGAEHGHYPHVSRPEYVSHIIRCWLAERIFFASETDKQFKEGAVAYG